MNTRTENTLRNVKWNLFYKIVILLFPFLIKTLLIQKLGIEYLGLSGLFTSILTVLSLAELGFSSAIIYSLYKPVADNDAKKICALLSYYQKIYRIIGIIILIVGLAFLPFLKYLIKGELPSDINVYLLYLIYLINTVISYLLFSYKSCIIAVYQRNDLLSKINFISKIFLYIFQNVLLLLYANYYLYVLVFPLSTVILNLLTLFISKKYFPSCIAFGEIDTETRNEIKKQVKGILVGKICSVLESSLDIIAISWLIGLKEVGMFNNYMYIQQSVIAVLAIFPESMQASIGNCIATDGKEKNYNDFVKFNFIYMFIASVCVVCIYCLTQEFITLWIGKEFLFSNEILVLFCVYFFVLKNGDIISSYFGSAGLYKYGKRAYILEVCLNLVLNILLGKLWGISGILIATIFSLAITNIGILPKIVFEKYFCKKVAVFYLQSFFYFFATILVAFLLSSVFSIFKFFHAELLCFLLKGVCTFVLSCFLLCVLYFKLPFFKSSLNFVKEIFKNLLKEQK